VSFFGVLRRGVGSDFTVEDCHLNFWILPRGWRGFFCHYFALDIGLRVKAGTKPFSWLRLAVPFDCEDGVRPTDLSSFLLEEQFTTLIFGKPAAVDGTSVVYKDPGRPQEQLKLNVVRLDIKNCIPEAENQHKNGFSTWKIGLERNVQPGDDCYFRFRLPVKSPKRYWLSQGWGLAKKGNIVDIRIADARESALLFEGEEEIEHIAIINRMFLFVGMAANFLPRHASPDFYYSRALEPKVWNKYLGSIGRFNESTKIVIHQWRNAKQGSFESITKDNPFRVYMDVTREFGIELLLLYSVAILLPLLFQLVRYLYIALWL
jgi:hypothetical protein